MITLMRSLRFKAPPGGLHMFLCLLAILLLMQGCHFPRDPSQTLTHIEDGVMHVGVIENPPWVIRTASGAEGLEPELIRSLAESLNAEIRWHWGGESELITALHEYELDLVIGGLIKGAPLRPVVAFTKPYLSTKIGVGAPPGEALPAQLNGQTVAVRRTQAMSHTLKEKGARPAQHETLAQTQGLVAAPRWWLQAHGYEVGSWTLDQPKHVMAVPPGENAWLLHLQRYLNGQQGLRERLSRLEADNDEA